jgi:hypothetical protein
MRRARPLKIASNDALGVLVGATSTLLSMLAAAVATYFVFLQDRGAQYDARIESNRLQIRELAFRLNIEFTVGSLLPPDFDQMYADAHPGKSSIALAEQAMSELFAQNPELARIVTSASRQGGKFYEGEWRGRTLLWSLTLVSRALSPHRNEGMDDKFPMMAVGDGFDEWVRMFHAAQLTVLKGSILWDTVGFQDLQQYTARLESSQREAILRSINQILPAFFRNVEAVSALLRDSELQMGLREQCSFERRMDVFPLLVLSILAFFCGVFVPLLLLLVLEYQTLSIRLGSMLIVSALFSSLLAVTVFGYNLSGHSLRQAEPPGDPQLERLRSELTDNSARAMIYDALSLVLLTQYMSKPDAQASVLRVQNELQNYAASCRKFNLELSELETLTAGKFQLTGMCACRLAR